MNNNPEPLPAKNSEDLRTVCTSLKLGDCFEVIEEITQWLQLFERHGKDQMKSARGKIKALGNVAAAAKTLAAAINELNAFQKIDIGNKLPPDGLRTGCEWHISYPGASIIIGAANPATNPDCHVSYPFNTNLHGRVGHIGIEADRLSKCCGEIYKEENTSGVKGGRKPTLDRYAFCIGEIWDAVQSRNINLGRGGTFEQLCEAVFFAAGVRTGPEAAIRRFIEKRKAAANTPDDEPF